jgi:hypothetical protein
MNQLSEQIETYKKEIEDYVPADAKVIEEFHNKYLGTRSCQDDNECDEKCAQ